MNHTDLNKGINFQKGVGGGVDKERRYITKGLILKYMK